MQYNRTSYYQLVSLLLGGSIFIACSGDGDPTSSSNDAITASDCKTTESYSKPKTGAYTCWTEYFGTDSSGTGYCGRDYKDDCCEKTTDGCGTIYGEKIASYYGTDAHSNGACTTGGSGYHQCVRFVQDFLSTSLKYSIGSLGNANKAFENAQKKTSHNKEIFTVAASEGKLPRETDVLVYDHGQYGHVVIVRDGITTTNDGATYTIPLIEENVASGSPCYQRKATATRDSNGSYTVSAGFNNNVGWTFLGMIRHNLAGFYAKQGEPNDVFKKKYTSYAGKLGYGFNDHGGGPFVHDVRGVMLQNFESNVADNRFGTDGQTALALGKDGKSAYLLKEGFWGAYKCIPGSDGKALGGAEYLGAPKTDELQGKLDGNCQIIPNAGQDVPTVTYQQFEGGCLWWRDAVDGNVHIHLYSGNLIDATKATACGVKVENNPPSADCKDDCTPGTQQCLGSSQIQICGHPGPDSCYHWLTNSCASGTACVSNSCVSVIPSTGGTTGAGGTSSTGGSVSTGGSTPVGIQNCVHSARRCTSNPNTYDACIKDLDSGDTNWMTLDCSAGYICTPSSGRCDTPIPIGSGGASSTGGTTSVVIATGGSPSFGGTSSVGGTTFVATGGAPIATGGVSSTGGMSAVGGAMSSGGTASVDNTLRFHYEGSVAGNYIVKAWWNTLTSADSWNTSLSSRGCIDTDISDKSFDCVLPVPSGKQDFLFQVDLPDGRFWGDMSYDPTGGQGATIGTVTITKGNVTYNYVMVSNGEGPLYMNGLLSVVP